jgi:hypothetical protein
MKKSMIMMLALSALLGCSKMELIQGVDTDSHPVAKAPVKLTGIIDVMNTRAAVGGTKPSQALSVDIYRANATSASTFGSDYLPGVIDATFQTDGNITFTQPQYYLPDGKSSRFIAVYPKTTAPGQYVYANKTIEYAIDGDKDIMASTTVEGSKTSPVSATSSMVFSHLLTQIKVQVVADNQGIADAWGNVTGITVNGKQVDALVTLPVPSTTGAATVAAKSGSVPAALSIVHSHGAGGLAIPVGSGAGGAGLFGYALFLPTAIGTTETLTLNITTVNSGAAVIKPTSPVREYKASHVFTITITFKGSGGESIEVDVDAGSAGSLIDWTNDNSTTTADV